MSYDIKILHFASNRSFEKSWSQQIQKYRALYNLNYSTIQTPIVRFPPGLWGFKSTLPEIPVSNNDEKGLG